MSNKSPNYLQIRPRRSLRNILIFTLLLFSVAPVAFVTIYSIVKYEKAIDKELTERLMANGREITSILNDLKSVLQQRRDHYVADSSFLYHLSIGDELSVKRIANDWMKSEISNELIFFNRAGRVLVSLSRDDKSGVKDQTPPPSKAIVLADTTMEKLKFVNSYPLVEHSKSGKASLVLFSKVMSTAGRHIGFLEQTLEISSDFLTKMKEKMKVELIVLRSNGAISAATLPDFALNKKNYFETYTKSLVTTYLEHTVRGEPHGFLVYPISWGNSDFFVALGASKREAKEVLKNVNFAFYSVVVAILLLLIVTIWLTSSAFVKPLWELVEATQNIQQSDQPVEIPVTSRTEIGLLAEAFNSMSRNIIKVRSELKSKILELEKANQEIQETQSKLVHSSKMISLGQLVAGVAHELNNPIGFIYSNMSHLKDYSDRLLRYAETAESDPIAAKGLKESLEISFIRKDLPKLVSSCEDGARRTRDIVIGLRNFSRLEGTQIKALNINEAIDSTLNILSGELKTRIEIERRFADLPSVECFASQISQVFMNVFTNAIQAIESTGKIWITTQLVQKKGQADQVSIAVQDSGMGMTPDTLDKIFDPFFSTKEVGQGTGLGLSISYGIIQNHGGEILVQSKEGSGTVFTILIPVIADRNRLRESVDKKPA